MKYRNSYLTAIYSALTFGLYNIYWIYITKKEINEVGGAIPTILLYLVPQPFIYTILRFFNIQHYFILDLLILILPLFFWYKFISNFVNTILKNNSKLVKLKWFVTTLSIPLAISILTPILLTATIIAFFNLKYFYIEIYELLKYLMPNKEINNFDIFNFLIVEWIFFSFLFFIFFIPQIFIQKQINKKI